MCDSGLESSHPQEKAIDKSRVRPSIRPAARLRMHTSPVSPGMLEYGIPFRPS